MKVKKLRRAKKKSLSAAQHPENVCRVEVDCSGPELAEIYRI